MNHIYTKHLEKQMLLSLLFSIINLVFFIKSDVIFEWLFFVPLITVVYLFILVLKERKLFDVKKSKVRFVFLIIAIVFILISIILFINDSNRTLLEVSSVLCLLTTYFNMIITLIKTIVIRFRENKKQYAALQVDELDGVEPTIVVDKKTYPIGYISKKDYLITVTIIIVLTFAILIYTLVSAFSNDDVNLGNLIAGLVMFMLEYVLVAICRQKIVNKPLIEFENDFNFEKLEEKANEIINNPKINFETRNYYKIILANYAGFFDLEKRKELLMNISAPKNPMYKLIYDQVLSLEFIDDDEKIIEIYENMLKEPLYQAKNFQKIINKYIHQTKISCGMIDVANIDNEFKEVRQTKLAKHNNLMIKLKYYYYKNDIENNKDVRNQIDELNKFIPESKHRSERVERFTL